MDKQRSTKHTCKAKDRVTRTPLKTGVELKCLISTMFWFQCHNSFEYGIYTHTPKLSNQNKVFTRWSVLISFLFEHECKLASEKPIVMPDLQVYAQ